MVSDSRGPSRSGPRAADHALPSTNKTRKSRLVAEIARSVTESDGFGSTLTLNLG